VQRAGEPFGANACIFASGDIPCPAGAYSHRHVVYGQVSDTRGCSSCTCGIGYAECGRSGGYFVRRNGTCQDSIPPAIEVGPTRSYGNVGDCIIYPQTFPLPITATGVTYWPGTDQVACDPAGATDATPLGEASPSAPVTACCLGPSAIPPTQ
jgi:hypothetical protein